MHVSTRSCFLHSMPDTHSVHVFPFKEKSDISTSELRCPYKFLTKLSYFLMESSPRQMAFWPQQKNSCIPLLPIYFRMIFQNEHSSHIIQHAALSFFQLLTLSWNDISRMVIMFGYLLSSVSWLHRPVRYCLPMWWFLGAEALMICCAQPPRSWNDRLATGTFSR